MNEPSTRPLSQVPAGQHARVAALAGGSGFQQHLVSMGLTVGREFQVIRGGNGTGGPTLIALGQMRLAIGHGMAERILVSVARAGEP